MILKIFYLFKKIIQTNSFWSFLLQVFLTFWELVNIVTNEGEDVGSRKSLGKFITIFSQQYRLPEYVACAMNKWFFFLHYNVEI